MFDLSNIISDFTGNSFDPSKLSDLQSAVQNWTGSQGDFFSVIGQLAGGDLVGQIQTAIQRGDIQGAVSIFQTAANQNTQLHDLLAKLGGTSGLSDLLTKLSGK